MPKTKQLEHKTIPFEVKSLDEVTGIFEGYGSTFGGEPDSYGDVVDAGAFAKTIAEGMKRIKVLWNHNVYEPIGRPLELSEDEHGLRIKGQLSLGVQRAREVLALMKDGVVTELSIGYDTITEAIEGKVRHLKEVRLWDVSPVTFAANPEALILSAKSDSENEEAAQLDGALKALLSAGPDKSTLADGAAVRAAISELEAASSGFDANKANGRIDAFLKK